MLQRISIEGAKGVEGIIKEQIAQFAERFKEIPQHKSLARYDTTLDCFKKRGVVDV